MLKKISLPVQLLFIIGLSFILGNNLNEIYIRYIYTFSMIFKEILGFFLPFIISTFILSGILGFKKNSYIVLIIMLSCIFASNFIVSLLSFEIGKSALKYLIETEAMKNFEISSAITPIFDINIPSLISSETAMLTSLFLGILGDFFTIPKLENGVLYAKSIVEKLFSKLFIPMIPLYVLGFLVKLVYEGNLTKLFGFYGKTFALILLIQLVYFIVSYFIFCGFNMPKAISCIKNSMPSYLTAFSTMSSTAAIPITFECMKKNTGNENISRISAPIMANVHLNGDSITVPIFALVTMFIFLGNLPSTWTFLVFVFYFCLAMLAVSSVPGGGIIVMIPILKSKLGFTPEMVSVITALYMLQDAFGTAGNVMGDGGLVILVDKILKKIKIY
jgi:Na+/H+-dicarboxylate symporter